MQALWRAYRNSHFRAADAQALVHATAWLRRTVTTLAGVPPPAIEKLLIANRGEIACRIITTARRLGIPTAAVFSDADADALHVALADQAVRIGPAAAASSYLRQEKVLDAAASVGATAIHPGYGFLSENASFASECERRGMAFVGPSASAIQAMGDKAQAKRLMDSAGVPIVPGYHEDDQSDERLASEADCIGYPLLVKAVMGGGGKGMKLARTKDEFMDALNSARREAMAAFGDDRMILERFIEVPRHIEVQIMADADGNYYYLAERDCSVQRRHQKIIEEAPGPGISADFRRSLGASAVDAAKAVGYRSAGTVEFIVDAATGRHYFMEMNTRLQVEHPVTEAITGLDLVELQLRVAAGESLKKLGMRQKDLSPVGHAIEARLYAENPHNDFLPSGGKLLRWRLPEGASSFHFIRSGEYSILPQKHGMTRDVAVRVDSGVQEGDTVGVHYDPMIAKVIVRASNRDGALDGLSHALRALQVAGFPTNVGFIDRVLRHEEFRAGPVDTGFIPRNEETLLAPSPLTKTAATIAVVAVLMKDISKISHTLESDVGSFVGTGTDGGSAHADKFVSIPDGPWSISDSFRLNHQQISLMPPITHVSSDSTINASLKWEAESSFMMSCDLFEPESYTAIQVVRSTNDSMTAVIDGSRCKADMQFQTHGEHCLLDLWLESQHYQFTSPIVRKWSKADVDAADSSSSIASPMPGRVIRVCTHPDATVKAGSTLCIVEAMKMEHPVRAPRDGQVIEVLCFQGSQVEEGQVLVVMKGTDQQ